jgi:DNA-damage-inducible protein J
MVTVHAQAQVDVEVELRAAEVLRREGLTLDEAMRQMLTRTADQGALPFLREGAEELYGDDDPEYDAWFRAKVEDAMNDSRPPVSHEEMRRRMESRRAAAMARLR